jgi:hypothetical protein
MSTPLTFGELRPGDFFIGFPVDGDDSGHGGYRNGSYLFIKLRDGVGCDRRSKESTFPDSMRVLLVLGTFSLS